MMTQHLLDLGHRDIAFIQGPDSHSSSAQRLSGFESAISKAGLSLDRIKTIVGDYTVQSGVNAAKILLSHHNDRPSAIFAANDDMAAGVVTFAARQGIVVPDELSVCGFDDTPIAEILWPKLTTIAQPIQEMGRQAVEMLIDKSESKGSNTTTLEFELVVRASTGPVRNDG